MSQPLVIPADLTACQALINELAQTIADQQQTIVTLQQTNAEQKLTIDEFIRRMFLRRSERYILDPRQLQLDLGDTDEAADAAAGLGEAVEQAGIIVGEHERRKRAPKKPRNEQLPDHLPRYEVTLEVPDDVSHCPEHGERKQMDFVRIETLEFERPKLKVRVTLIPKFVCEGQPACGVQEPPRPAGLVEGNRYDTSIVAEIIAAKYGYHLPIYRQQDWFAGSGWMPQRSTLLNILASAGRLIRPFIEYLRSLVLDSIIVGTDETRVTLLLPPEIPAAVADDPKSQRIYEVFSAARAEGKPSVSARMWVYRSMLIPINVFDFTVSRHRDGPDAFLVAGKFSGKLMADCYAGFQGLHLRSDARIERGACNAHARRKVFEARENHPLLSSQLLAMYRELYDIEDRARDMTYEERRALREREARPVWQRMRELLDSPAAAKLLPKDKFAEALQYMRNQWDALTLYLSDGRLPIDNNDVEQLMKQVALGRNYAESCVMRSCGRVGC
jgi:transposase